MKKVLLASLGVVLVVFTAMAIVGAHSNKAQQTVNNAAQLKSCLGDIETSTSAQLSGLYEQAKLPQNSATSQNALLLAVNSRIDSETGCYSRYKPTTSKQENVSLQQECLKTNNDYYGQFVDLATSQSVLDPSHFPNSSQYAIQFGQAKDRAAKNCTDYYPVN